MEEYVRGEGRLAVLTSTATADDFKSTWYSRGIAGRPVTSACALFSAVALLSGLTLPLGEHLEVDVLLEGFEAKDHYTSRREAGRVAGQRNAYRDDDTGKGSLRRGARVLGPSGYEVPYTYPKWRLSLLYMAAEGKGNLLEAGVLAQISSFERKVYRSKAYQAAGWRDTHSPFFASGENTGSTAAEVAEQIERVPPAPVSSLLQYVYPSLHKGEEAVEVARRMRCCSNGGGEGGGGGDCPWMWQQETAASNGSWGEAGTGRPERCVREGRQCCPRCETCSGADCRRCGMLALPDTAGDGVVFDGLGETAADPHHQDDDDDDNDGGDGEGGGGGDDGARLARTLRYVVQGEHAVEAQWFFGKDFNAHQLTTTRLRSEIVLGAPFPGFAHAGSGGQDGAVEPSVEELTRVLDTFSVEGVRLVYGGDIVTEAAILRTLKRDSCIAVASIVVVLLYMVFHLRSLFLSTCAMGQLLVTFPVSLFFYAVVFRESYLGPLNILSFYIMVGIGVDDIFVFSNAFFYCEKPSVLGEGGKGSSVFTRRDSWSITKPVFQSDSVPLEQRTAYALRKAGPPMLVTSTTSAAAFMANMISSIPAVRSFGLLMGILVIVNYLLVMSLYPAVLCLWVMRVKPLYTTLCDKVGKGTETVVQGPPSIASPNRGIEMTEITEVESVTCEPYELPEPQAEETTAEDVPSQAAPSACEDSQHDTYAPTLVRKSSIVTLSSCHVVVPLEANSVDSDLVIEDVCSTPRSVVVKDDQDLDNTDVCTELPDMHMEFDDNIYLLDEGGKPTLRKIIKKHLYPLIYKWRVVFLIFFVVLVGLSLVATTRLTHQTSQPSFFSSDHSIHIYQQKDTVYLKSGNCVEETRACGAMWVEHTVKGVYGCDGVLYSGAKKDVCGVCKGNGGTCVGCDGVLGSGLVWSNCGVCGGSDLDCPTQPLPETAAPSAMGTDLSLSTFFYCGSEKLDTSTKPFWQAVTSDLITALGTSEITYKDAYHTVSCNDRAVGGTLSGNNYFVVNVRVWDKKLLLESAREALVNRLYHSTNVLQATSVYLDGTAFGAVGSQISSIQITDFYGSTAPDTPSPLTWSPPISANPIPTGLPTTLQPRSLGPSTAFPETHAGITAVPTTLSSSTVIPSRAPVTAEPVFTTESPTTMVPVASTPAPVVSLPETNVPDTNAPVVEGPISPTPTSETPINTAAPGTDVPDTMAPKTETVTPTNVTVTRGPTTVPTDFPTTQVASSAPTGSEVVTAAPTDTIAPTAQPTESGTNASEPTNVPVTATPSLATDAPVTSVPESVAPEGSAAPALSTDVPSSKVPSSEVPTETSSPFTDAPSTGQPSTGQPTTGQPSTGQPSTGQPSAGQPTTGKPSTGQPTTGKPTTGQPSTGQPSTGQPTTGQPSTGQPSTGQLSTEQPPTGQPSTGQPTTGKPSTEQPSTGQPSTGQPSTGQPSTGQPSTGQPSTGQPTTGKPSTEQPSTGQPSTEQPSTGQPSTEVPVTQALATQLPATETINTVVPASTTEPTVETNSSTTETPTSGAPSTADPATTTPESNAPLTTQQRSQVRVRRKLGHKLLHQ